MEIGDNLSFWLHLWLGIVLLIILVQLIKKTSCGILFAYLTYFGILHWLAATFYQIPWYSYFEPRWVLNGLRESTFAALGIAIGSLILAPLLLCVLPFARTAKVQTPDPRLPKTYILTGLVFYFVIVPTLGQLPTLQAITSSGWNLMVVGLGLTLWKTWHEKKRKKFLIALLVGFTGLPALTILTQGFLGFGAVAFLAVFTFTANFVRPKWQVLLFSLLFGYAAISFYVTYMRDRSLIREMVWGGESSSKRSNQLLSTVKDFEWFDLSNEKHLRRIDDRLNQNWLLGVSVEELSSTNDFAYGETLWDAVLALIPRVLWPSKPITAGSGGLVTRFTGIPFAEGTSVGIGHVMEFYVNFGTPSVVIGFIVLGTLVTLFDTYAARCLRHGDWQGFASWFLPALSFLNLGGSLVELTVCLVGSMVLIGFVNKFILPLLSRKRFQATRS